jgi:hypothetical protein
MFNVANSKLFAKTFLTKFVFLALVVTLIVSLGIAQVQAKTNTVTTDREVNFNQTAFVPCAARGAGEYVTLTGTLHILVRTTFDGKGRFQSRYEFQPKGVSGTGLSTGTVYRGTDGGHGTINGTVGVPGLFEDSFTMASKGDHFIVRVNARVNTSPSGSVFVFLDGVTITCKRPGYPSYP